MYILIKLTNILNLNLINLAVCQDNLFGTFMIDISYIYRIVLSWSRLFFSLSNCGRRVFTRDARHQQP